MDAEHVELNLGLLGRRVELGHRAERRGARVGAQDRDLPAGQFVGQLGPFGRIGEVDATHLHGHAVASGQPGRQLLENLGAPRRDDQVVAAGGEFGGQRFTDALGGTGDDGPTVRGWGGNWHAAIVRGSILWPT